MTNQEIALEYQLYELGSSDARIVLENFLRVERDAFESVPELATMHLDHSRESVVAFFKYAILEKIGDRPNVDINIFGDDFLRDESRVVWLSRMAFYLGEALIKASKKLRWDIGNEEAAFANHPVIAGFKGGMEAPVITIAKNMTARVLMDRAPLNAVMVAVAFWFDLAPT